MKKIIIASLLLVSIKSFAQQKVDTVKKYVVILTESEYQAIQQKLSEAAAYEAQLQRDKIDASYQEFLKQNTKQLPNKESK